MPNRTARPNRMSSLLTLAFLSVWELHVLSQHACDYIDADNICRSLRNRSVSFQRPPTITTKNLGWVYPCFDHDHSSSDWEAASG